MTRLPVILAASGAVPQRCLAVRKDLDPELKCALRKALFAVDREGEEALHYGVFGARGSIGTIDCDYEYLFNLSSDVGANLKIYRYHDE